MKRKGIFLVVVVVVLLGIISLIPGDKSKVLDRLHDAGVFPQSILITYHDSLQIHVMQAGDSTKQVLLLIHGSPGEWSAWENIILNDSIRNSFRILSVDRSGYGGTTVPASADLSTQASVIWHALKKLTITDNIYLAGHSYGGAVAEQLLIDHPQAFSLAILVAPTLSPELTSPRWYNKVASWKLVNKLISDDLRASNLEMNGLPASLLKNEPKIALIKTPIVYIQGMEDVLVPHETVDYFKEHKPYGVHYIIIEDMNHFTPWSDPSLITDAILAKSK